jgi:hypothetical protein
MNQQSESLDAFVSNHQKICSTGHAPEFGYVLQYIVCSSVASLFRMLLLQYLQDIHDVINIVLEIKSSCREEGLIQDQYMLTY